MRRWYEQKQFYNFTDHEVEMIEMLICEHKQQNEFDMSPNRGFRSNLILHSLHENYETSKLHYFDIHDASIKYTDDIFLSHWIFEKGDYTQFYDKGNLVMVKFDFFH